MICAGEPVKGFGRAAVGKGFHHRSLGLRTALRNCGSSGMKPQKFRVDVQKPVGHPDQLVEQLAAFLRTGHPVGQNLEAIHAVVLAEQFDQGVGVGDRSRFVTDHHHYFVRSLAEGDHAVGNTGGGIDQQISSESFNSLNAPTRPAFSSGVSSAMRLMPELAGMIRMPFGPDDDFCQASVPD
jgi:hypothetical protein